MVAICKNSYFWQAIQREKRISSRWYPFVAENESFEVPEIFYALKERGKNKFASITFRDTETLCDMGTYLIAFVTRQQAREFLRSESASLSDFAVFALEFLEAKERVREKPCIVGVIVYGGKKPFPLPFHCPHL